MAAKLKNQDRTRDPKYANWQKIGAKIRLQNAGVCQAVPVFRLWLSVFTFTL